MKKSIEQLRRDIDELDDRIVQLLNQRAALAIEVGAIKKASGDALYVPARERDVLKRLMARNQGPLSHRSLCRIYREIMAASLAIEHRDRIIAGGAGKADLTHAVHFLAGVDADAVYCERIEEMIDTFAAANDSLLVVSDDWHQPAVTAFKESGHPLIWLGCWSIVAPVSDKACRYHVMGHTHQHVVSSRPVVIYCLMESRVFDQISETDWLRELPASSFEFNPLIDQPDRGILKISVEMSARDVQENWSALLGRQSVAVWIV